MFAAAVGAAGPRNRDGRRPVSSPRVDPGLILGAVTTSAQWANVARPRPCRAVPRYLGMSVELDVGGVHRRSNPAGVDLGRGSAAGGHLARHPERRFAVNFINWRFLAHGVRSTAEATKHLQRTACRAWLITGWAQIRPDLAAFAPSRRS
jgi:hypothetical protein